MSTVLIPVQEWALDLPAAAESSVTKANRFVDQLLADNRQKLQDAIGVVVLPDEYFEFSKTIFFVETHGFAKLTKGRLDNLHAISRLEGEEEEGRRRGRKLI